MAREGPFTRAELIEATGLSAPTVGSLATSLIRARPPHRPRLRAVARRTPPGPHGVQSPARVRRGHRSRPHAHHGSRSRTCRGELLLRRVVNTPDSKASPPHCSTPRAETARAVARRRCAAEPAARSRRGCSRAQSIPLRGMIVALAPNLRGWTDSADGRHPAYGAGCAGRRRERRQPGRSRRTLEGRGARARQLRVSVVRNRHRRRDHGERPAPSWPPCARRRNRPDVHGTAIRERRLRIPRMPRDACRAGR